MRRAIIILTTLFFALSQQLSAKSSSLSLKDLSSKLIYSLPGDTILIESGIYKDIKIELKAFGTRDNPIVIRCAKPGEVIITGNSSLKLAGEWVEIDGLYFRDGTPPAGSSVIEYRLGDDIANNCRITNCVVDSFNPSGREVQYSYVLLFGRGNRFDHNSLLNKLNLGVTLIVMLNQERDQQNFHRIDHNYFGPRPVFGSNGAETIRVGTATQALQSSNTVIEYNYFDRCNGEVEVISIKSSDNIIRYNYFIESQGVLALRHGDRNIAHNNFFDGNGIRNTGGIRVINASHKIFNNTFYRLKGERFFAALAVMNAVPNSLPNRYCLVENVDINGNSFIDCDHISFGVGSDQERTLEPSDVRFFSNRILNTKIPYPYEMIASVKGFVFKDNSVKLKKGAKLPNGFIFDESLDEFELLKSVPVKREECGVSWTLHNSLNIQELSNRRIAVNPGQDNILKAISQASAGDIIELTSEGEYPVSGDIFIDFPITIQASAGLKSRPVIRYNGSKQGNIITIRDSGELTITGVALNGMSEPGKATAGSGISTASTMIKPYLLVVDSCEFFDFPEGSTVPVRGLKNTFSQKIIIRNSLFRAISADAINYAGERDDAGKYNVEELIVENCSFNRILGLGINVYRGGSDESTAGPIVNISNCTFEDVCNKERGSVMRLIGPQVLNVSGCNFSNSGRAGFSIRLDEATFEKVKVVNCNFWNSGKILTVTGKVVKGKMLSEKPQYLNADKFDYRSQKTSKLYNKNIGVR
ncbi:MAG: poly(beta-D-mannuronate) lyase [Bacteroidetes bacterium HGW-Bacteroidetes-8]|jgi:poly(beta-D-mannuronate) lyase|nr:MAG: poly(beta-D-mannuronate) lyase [Bacteroidetes bacterium HGW-Bacteroidetes-8]